MRAADDQTFFKKGVFFLDYLGGANGSMSRSGTAASAGATIAVSLNHLAFIFIFFLNLFPQVRSRGVGLSTAQVTLKPFFI